MKPKSGAERDVVPRLFSLFGGKSQTEEFPLLPLRDLVLFPQTVIPIFITYPAGIRAVEAALGRDLRLFLACLKPFPGEWPGPVTDGFPPIQEGPPRAADFGHPRFSGGSKKQNAAPPPPPYTGTGGGDTW